MKLEDYLKKARNEPPELSPLAEALKRRYWEHGCRSGWHETWEAVAKEALDQLHEGARKDKVRLDWLDKNSGLEQQFWYGPRTIRDAVDIAIENGAGR